MAVRIRRYLADGAAADPLVTIVVPTRRGDRDGSLSRVDSFLAGQRFRDFEVIAVIGDDRQGRAINRAARLGTGRILVTLDDDSELHDPETVGRVVEALEGDRRIGIAGTSTVPGPRASAFQRLAVREVPRRFFPIVGRTIDSDMAQHPCMAMRREVFLALGGEDEDLVRGLDPLLRHKFRRAGYRVVIVRDAWISHPLPDDLGAIARMYFRNGRGSAFAQARHPERIYELTDGFERGRFAPQRPILYRAARYLWRLYRSCIELKVVRLSSELSYAAGYVYELGAARIAGGAPRRGRNETARRPSCRGTAL
jgi:GT2 family glycosyltransferase